jgi:hypothetical protein
MVQALLCELGMACPDYSDMLIAPLVPLATASSSRYVQSQRVLLHVSDAAPYCTQRHCIWLVNAGTNAFAMCFCIITTYRHLIVPADIAAVLAEHDDTISATATTKLQYQATVEFDSSSSSDSAAPPSVTIGAYLTHASAVLSVYMPTVTSTSCALL